MRNDALDHAGENIQDGGRTLGSHIVLRHDLAHQGSSHHDGDGVVGHSRIEHGDHAGGHVLSTLAGLYAGVHLLHQPVNSAQFLGNTANAAQQQALDSTRRKIDAQRARYERDQRNAKARLQRMSAREKAVLREKERQEEQLDTAIAELQKLTKGNKAGASFSTRTSNLNLPVEGGRVKRYRDNMAEITGPKGARITAIYEGKVVDVKRNRITNRFDVYIAHGQYITSYANLNSVSVAKGQTVAKNSAIGVIGPAVDIQTMKTEYRLVFGIYPPAGAKKMRASDCFRK